MKIKSQLLGSSTGGITAKTPQVNGRGEPFRLVVVVVVVVVVSHFSRENSIFFKFKVG